MYFVPQYSAWYGSLLVQVATALRPRSPIPAIAVNLIYGSSLTCLIFLSLMIATSAVAPLRRLASMALGLVAFMITDLSFVQWAIFAEGRYSLGWDSVVLELYMCFKWLLPFLLWVVMSYRHFGEFFRPAAATGPEAEQQ